MSWEKVSAEIDKIGQIVKDWEKSAKVSVIDREVVLDKLRQVYEQVKFAQADLVAGNSEPQAWPTEQAASPEPVQRISETPAQTAIPAVESESPNDSPNIVSPESLELQKESPAHKATAHEAGGGEEAVVGSPEEKLAVMDDLLLRPKRDKKAIMSLYGDKEEPSKESKEAVFTPKTTVKDAESDGLGSDVLGAIGLGDSEQSNVNVKEPQKMAAHQTPIDLHSNGNGAGTQDTKKVLGETIRPGETLSDVYARTNNHHDVAGKINGGKLGSIRSAIGINDKFLLIRDLFAGDAAAYDKTMAELDSFADLDDALLYIHDNFRWNPDSDGVKLLMDLLTRKL